MPTSHKRRLLQALGCALPLLTPPRMLPPSLPGAQPPDDLLPLLGRTLDVVPATVLADPDNDPLALARLPSDPPNAFQLVVRELDGGTLVEQKMWAALKCDATSCVKLAPTAHGYQPVAPLLAVAGWYPPQPAVAPTTLTQQGNLTRFINITGLVSGTTRLADELRLLYPDSVIAQSSLAQQLLWVWNGTAFVAPA